MQGYKQSYREIDFNVKMRTVKSEKERREIGASCDALKILLSIYSMCILNFPHFTMSYFIAAC